MMSTAIPPTSLSPVDQRLARMHLQPVTASAIIAALIILVADSQSLALIPVTTAMASEYHITAAQVSIVIAMVALVAAGALPVITRVAERISLRRFLLIGLSTATIGNVICALATKDDGFVMLVIGRAILGLSAASPIATALIREKSRNAQGTNRAMGIVTAAIGIGVGFSYLLGGVILHFNGTVSIVFWVLAGLSVLSLVLGWVITPDFHLSSRDSIDYLGAFFLIVGLTGVAISISFSTSWPLGTVLGFLVGGLIVLALWVVVELRVKNPLINLRVTFKRTTVAAYFSAGLYAAIAVLGNLAATTYAQMDIPGDGKLASAGIASSQTAITALGGQAQATAFGQAAGAAFSAHSYGLTDWGHSVLASAMFLMPTTVFVFLGGFLIGPIVAKLGVKTTMIIGAALALAASVQLALYDSAWWALMLGMAIWGLAFALGYTACAAAPLHAAKDSEATQFSAAGIAVYAGVAAFGSPIFVAFLTAFPQLGTITGTGAAAIKQTLAATPLAAVPAGDAFIWCWFASAIGCVVLLILAFLHKNTIHQGSSQEAVASHAE